MEWCRELGDSVFVDEEFRRFAINSLSNSELEESGIEKSIAEMSALHNRRV